MKHLFEELKVSSTPTQLLQAHISEKSVGLTPLLPVLRYCHALLLNADTDLTDSTLAVSSAIWKLAATRVLPPYQDQASDDLMSLVDVLRIVATREEQTKKCIFALRSGLRFLSNAVTDFESNQQIVWTYAFPVQFLLLFEHVEDRQAFATVFERCIFGLTALWFFRSI